jgi:hypothetical protein
VGGDVGFESNVAIVVLAIGAARWRFCIIRSPRWVISALTPRQLMQTFRSSQASSSQMETGDRSLGSRLFLLEITVCNLKIPPSISPSNNDCTNGTGPDTTHSTATPHVSTRESMTGFREAF